MPPEDPRISLELSGRGVSQGASNTTRTAEELLARFTDGTVAVGARLPSERTLADDLRVGRSAIREALAVLEILGIVEVRPGSGAYLRSTSSELLPQTLSWSLLLNAPTSADLLGIREALEIKAAELAAVHHTDAQREALADAVRDQAAGLDDVARFVEADLRFHLVLADAANNPTLSLLLSTVRSLLRVWLERQVRRREDMELAQHEHALVLEAIGSRDPHSARLAMLAHMDTASERIHAAARAGVFDGTGAR